MRFFMAPRLNGVVRHTALVIGLAAWAGAPLATFAGDVDISAAARDVLAKHTDAIVRVTTTVKQDMAGFGIQFGGGGGERTAEAIGTVVDPSGIVVVDTSQLSPRMGNILVTIDGELQEIETKIELSKPVIHLADGTEVPARIALEDPDSGLTFFVPEKNEGKAFACVPPGPAMEVRPLDEVIMVSRLEKQYGSVPSAAISRVKAVVTKPRRGIVPVGHEYGAAFDHEGRFVGVTTIRMPSMKDATAGLAMTVPLIIPAADLADVVAQVREQAAQPAP